MENNVYNTRNTRSLAALAGLDLSASCRHDQCLVSTSQYEQWLWSGSTYPSLAATVTALNAATITSPVTITLTAEWTSITAQGSATNTIVIDGAGFTLTAFTPQTAGALNDAIIKLVGADFVTIQNFIMQENAANTTTAAGDQQHDGVGCGIALCYCNKWRE